MIDMFEVTNSDREHLSTIVEGNETSSQTLVLVHGFGTNKDELGLFIDISKKFSTICRIVRFDFSGYGESEGRQEDVTVEKMAADLAAVLKAVREKFGDRIIIIAHSLGGIVTAFLSPQGIEQTILTGIPHDSSAAAVASLVERIKQRGGMIDFEGVSTYPRKDGNVQKLGAQFWPSYKNLDRLASVTGYAQQTKLTIIKPRQDQVVDGNDSSKWKTVNDVSYFEIDGDHNFSGAESRKQVLNLLQNLMIDEKSKRVT